MPNTHWKYITDLVLEVLELPETQRDDFLTQRCTRTDGSIDTSLKKEIETWILAARKAESVDAFNSPVSGLAVDAAAAENITGFSLPEQIGPWHPIRRLGAGGMGVVYEAHRVDKSFDQRAALKLVRPGFLIDFGARFLRERSVLAELNHPGIARLLDGGITGEGVPYLATELIDGQPITNYCDERHFSIRDRLRIFAKVCDAVAYAHQNLVVHRDLKPGHIFVIEVDGKPAIKLLDFGIAKLLESRDDGLTQTGSVPYTPAYAAPEQLKSLPITTATDVYSLGVLLYELVAGKRPYDLEDTTAARIEELVCRRVPPAPSAQISDVSNRRVVKGELDQIVMKAISKEPERRYRSAHSLGDDVRRFLSGLPIDALPDIASYRLQKFVSRNRVAVSVASVVLVSLIVLVSAFTISINRQKNRAEAAAITASEEAARATAISGFLERVLRTPNTSWYVQAERKGPETPIIDVLNEAAQLIDTDFKSQPEIQADLHHIIGDTYMSLADVERTNYHHYRALAIRESLYVAPHPKLAEALYYISFVEGSLGRIVERSERLRQALDMLRLRNEGNNYPFILEELGSIAASVGEFEIAHGLLAEGLTFVDANFVEGTDAFRYRTRLLASIERTIGRSYLLAGDAESAAYHVGERERLLKDVPPIDGHYQWIENACFSGLQQMEAGNTDSAEQSLITCYDHTNARSLVYDGVDQEGKTRSNAVMERPASLSGWAANKLTELYVARGDETGRKMVEARAERYRSEVDSLHSLLQERGVFTDVLR
ncbi:MAG: serine/threonine protein kinase [Rhodothermales bacterium]|nr:serine/threonine protein kinase [Rhodothermales bacterium]